MHSIKCKQIFVTVPITKCNMVYPDLPIHFVSNILFDADLAIDTRRCALRLNYTDAHSTLTKLFKGVYPLCVLDSFK